MADKQTNRDRLLEITAGIEQGIKELFESEKYKRYLSVMSRFHRYSVNNTMLIFMQRPDATLVAGFNKWQKQFERHVKRGEHGITIIAPTPYKKKVEEMKRDPDTQVPILDADGKVVMEEREIEIPMFRPVKVFDVSQTDGKPLPELASSLSGTVPHYEAFVEALRRSAPVPIEFEAMAENMDGYFSSEQQRIAIREGMSEVQTVSATIHEVAHSKLHDPKKHEAEPTWKIVMVSEGGVKHDYRLDFATEAEAEKAAAEDGWRYVDENRLEWRLEVEEDLTAVKQAAKNRNTEEVEAESISYAVCQYFGIQTGENSFGYIASWSKDKELKELRASLETINKTSCELINDIERNYKEICKERGIDLTVTSEPKQTQQQTTEEEVPAEEVTSNAEPQANAAENLTGLQQKAQKIADQYKDLPLQDKIDMIAQTFGCETGEIYTSPCTGKWRGTSDMSIRFDNGTSLFIGNHPTPKAKTVKVQTECVNRALVQYNPEIVKATKEAALPALLQREAKDNEIAAQKGLKPYTLLNVEFNDGADEKTGGYIGWYYVTLAVDGKIYAHLETGLNHDIASGKVSDIPTRADYYPAGALKEADVDYVFNNVGFSSTSSLYSVPLRDDVRERAERILTERRAVLDQYPMPDPALTQDDLKKCGYLDSDLLPISKECAYELMERDLTVYIIQEGENPEMALDTTDLDAHDGIFALPREEWEQSSEFHEKVMDRQNRQMEREQAFLSHEGNCFAIYQVCQDDPQRVRFLELDWLKSNNIAVERSNYDLVYTAPLDSTGSTTELLEKLYVQFNTQKPVDFHSPSMSVSDIVAIKLNGSVSCHYCDSIGFAEVFGFLSDNPLKNAEMMLEDDYNMIDGIINNGQRQPPPQPERQEKRRSVVEQLKSQPKTEPKKTAPKKSAEREL